MKRSRGSALGTLLVLLLAFALLAVSAMVAAVAGFASAGQELESAHALAAAEAAAARVLAHWPDAASADLPIAAPWPDMPAERVAGATLRRDPPGVAQPWPSGASLGDDGAGFVLRHYTITATGRARRGARVTVEQGFTVLEPGP